ncbi:MULTISPECIES: NAD(P)/FAD-dependent oxidoreductase [Desulfococcus]|jgi:sarcosine oxidase subunit beta|uniref:FAD dependent oxidoreductase n=1 Tax=Desulfococcus multivorans DSM 2059 TaxID=1121405 RepID=S7U0M9_DESML|nr:FAD-dependent oxidoreductase [Desulfococcus multivorans]AOY56992.1 FAD-dependent oxidoreductase [Desulfococcus multivorans]AQU99511.1 FAD-binding oxidoreductase [Desulfococcus multivorans]EPR42882.1 FAD dependent oxidoreductase [Desulfococcus multivorans DSM 2059]MDX9817527.1 FAD-dependent oxidoreductase [Desulfococcus multivorans]SJZ90128.1 Glycine/D-amino acid oxidase [Desulfococcus multivorans DSM 2059]
MPKTYDAIIIGAGVIGTPIAYELAKKGYKTLNVDKQPDAGEGSTAGSCAIVRAHYSTEDGVAFAYEGFKYWNDWENYLENAADEKGLARFMKTGSLLIKSQGHDWRKVKKHYDAVGVEYKELTNEEVLKMVPVVDLHEFWPVKRPEDPSFFDEPTGMLEGAIFCPEGGYVNDPALSAHNIMRAAEKYGAEFMFNAEVVDIRSRDGRVTGITLKDGTQFDAPVVVNVGGPHSFKINQMAEGVWEGCNIKTRALRHEVMHCPSPEGYDYLNDGYHMSDGDIGCYYRPEVGNMFLIGSEDPECDPKEWVDPDAFYAGKGGPGRDNQLTEAQWKAQCYRLARRIPTLPVPNQPRGVCDLYDVSDDWIPIYDKSDLGGFYMAVGTSGNQYKNAPVVGAMMAELIDACEKQGLDHDKTPFQFKMRYTGRVLDVGFFSRKREINYDSSFSVNG